MSTPVAHGSSVFRDDDDDDDDDDDGYNDDNDDDDDDSCSLTIPQNVTPNLTLLIT